VSWKIVFRRGPKVERLSADSLEAAVALLADRARDAPGREAVDLRVRRFEPVHQVAARGELRGPGRAAGGVDVRGDGSVEAWTGRIRRQVVRPEQGEDAYAALRRVLSGPSASRRDTGSTSVDP
jgi:hypothetical protein